MEIGVPTARPVGTTVGPLDRGLQILEMFDGPGELITVGQIASELAISKSSASRLAATLESKRFLEIDGRRGSFRLGPRMLQLASHAAVGRSLQHVGRAHEERLARLTSETAHLGVLEGQYAITTDFVEGVHQIRMHTRIGKQTIAYASSMGKALLAGLGDEEVRALYSPWPHISLTEHTQRDVESVIEELHEVRRTGLAHDREEVEIGMRCIAAPVFDHRGLVAGALSVSGPAPRVEASYDKILGVLTTEAAGISAALGASRTTY